jgi:hypothetical protein
MTMFKYIHNIEGRLRLRATSLKANAPLARELQIEMGRIPGVHSVEINLLTGSILILHDGRKATMAAITVGFGPLAQACLCASLSDASKSDLSTRLAQRAVSYLVETVVERLLMASVAVLL